MFINTTAFLQEKRQSEMNLRKWYEKRGPRFIWQRGINLLERYGITSGKAVHRIEDCVETLAGFGCAPTFPTPGIIVQRYPQVIQHLQQLGAEIAVHSYHHINLSEVPVTVAKQQLMRAVRTFERFGVEVHGFRCPYLGYSTELLDSLPDSVFGYSSNKAVHWELENSATGENLFFETIRQFYHGKSAANSVCMPAMQANFIEVPVCVPDDLQLVDGLELGTEGIAQVWSQIMDQVYQRGELFTLLFHPELASFCETPFVSLLLHAKQLQPAVWIARLRDISDWWREKSNFKVNITPITTGLSLNFTCTPRATILVRGVENIESVPIWEGDYHRLKLTTLEVSTNPRPFVGLEASAPECTISFLREQGYILDTSETAKSCGIYLDNEILAKLPNEVELANYIETSPAPLVRFWRWPDGAKSALSITGDLDALSLIDYASRVLTH